jgi:hypothetical protein
MFFKLAIWNDEDSQVDFDVDFMKQTGSKSCTKITRQFITLLRAAKK